MMSVVAILFDQLPASDLGCYGGVIATPEFDALAAKSDLYDMCFRDDSSGGIDAAIRSVTSEPFPTVTDPELFAQAFESLLLSDSDFCGLRVTLPDQEQEHRTSSYDAFIGLMNEIHQENRGVPKILLVTGEAGTPNLSEENSPQSMTPVGERSAHLPLLISLPGQTVSRRRNGLLTTAEFPELFQSLMHSEEEYLKWRECDGKEQIEYRSGNWKAVRTREWLLMQNEVEFSNLAEHCRLFHKPEDRWEILDVSDQYPSVMENFFETGRLSLPVDSV